MSYITICWIDGKPIVYERSLTEEDKRKIEALYPNSEVRWEVRKLVRNKKHTERI